MLAGHLMSATLLLASSFMVTLKAASDFGYTSSGGSWVITSGDGLTITMDQDTCDITSMLLNDSELQYSAKNTHVNSGLGSVTSSLQTLTDSTIQITCKTTGLEQTYLFRPNENAIYMGTYRTADVDLAELRFLARLDRTVVNSAMLNASDTVGMSAIEATDVYSDDDGVTASKFYSGIPFIEDQVHGVTSEAGGVYFIMSDYAYEKSVGGPFFRDINNKFDVANELTFYMFSDHTRTEDYRYGFHGPYALVFTDGSAPSTSDVDFDFFQDLDLTGFTAETERGTVKGTITDTNSVLGSSDVVATFSNADAQYWVSVGSSASTFTSPLMRPGTYNATVYKKQLAVGSDSVMVTKGSTTKKTLKVTYELESSPIWRIGEWDGTPDGFLNAANVHKMHPSESRLDTWVDSLTFTPGTDDDSTFPMAMFRAVNDPITLSFTLSSAQAAEARTLKIGLTLAQSSGRCSVTVNSDWTAKVPASVAVSTRGVTRGVTLGNYKLYKYTIPTSALVTGTNKIELSIASGSTDLSEKWLSASVVFDALELV
ncbi:Rhamnogalacturonate lyase A [Phytophthora fragariae]|uniref:rhamnogalacturonan endolyase n=1 Tax=Phytophthora fragariae TaxID=53985 RepID=A0A6A3R3S8_9STRA|nr:Rhamnogalacturonate lyase A [Phytophthora fragariae]KAE8990481.1 Rhamnogalacturonate lyase A [Phytophthora fragariae]KAE9088821.1 Rhamnogalacturonate lyase A [Phytophthora fragariae]KAE9089568.1 Rhamnogalacturonate lyase A [Phytophthora fragariae]KAE9117676.1 Rhamnogalacturonate lyase A [Phytophthora fragariae]